MRKALLHISSNDLMKSIPLPPGVKVLQIRPVAIHVILVGDGLPEAFEEGDDNVEGVYDPVTQKTVGGLLSISLRWIKENV